MLQCFWFLTTRQQELRFIPMGRVHRKGRAKRFNGWATIDDLSEEVMSHIVSFLEKPCGLWTVRMVSRAFRDAANRNVSRLKVSGCIALQNAQMCSIICRVSPELLHALHKHPRDLEGLSPMRLPRCQCEGGVKLGDACFAPGFLPHIIEADIKRLPQGAITARPLRTEECTDATCLVPRPVPLEVALAHMPMLRQFRLLNGYRLPPNLIPHLISLTSLELSTDVSHDELAALASIRSIKSLGLPIRKVDDDHSARQVRTVCSGAFSHLRSLSLESVKARVWSVSALTYLTRLSLTLRNSGDERLEHLAVLTGLRELHIHLWHGNPKHPIVRSSFLGALTGLTRLNLGNNGWDSGDPWELFALTALDRLRELSLGIIPGSPSYSEGSPLPRELAFLGTATALQELDCAIALAYFEQLSTSAYAALQHALARLGSLTHLYLDYLGMDDTPHSYRPIELCSCAGSLQSLMFVNAWVEAGEAPRQGMFSSLQHLQRLDLTTVWNSQHIVSLLDSIKTPQLTELVLGVDSVTPAMMEPILRFSQLRDLTLYIGDSASLLPCLLQLSSLASLTGLRVSTRYGVPVEVLSAAGGQSVVEETMATVQADLKRLRYRAGWPPLELELILE
eukprot:jgi/Botrbrau1/22308/Bobra.0138s0059.1